MNTAEKTCFKCGAEKPLIEFYKHKQMADGHLNKCKDCTKMDAKARRNDPRFRDHVLEYDRRRGSRQGPEYQQMRRSMFPIQREAIQALNNAVRDGKIDKPDRCQHCHVHGVRICGHHEDYHKPLDVVWLCDACHRALHAFYNTIGRKISA